jgi:hypothetical protein
VSKKKTIVRVIKKHTDTGSYLNGEWYTAMATCGCGWEKECSDKNTATDLYAKHVYAMIKKALKRRKKIKELAELRKPIKGIPLPGLPFLRYP